MRISAQRNLRGIPKAISRTAATIMPCQAPCQYGRKNPARSEPTTPPTRFAVRREPRVLAVEEVEEVERPADSMIAGRAIPRSVAVGKIVRREIWKRSKA